MRLCDEINNFATIGHDPKAFGLPIAITRTPIYGAQLRQVQHHAEDIKRATRMILSDEVIEASTHLILSRPRSLLDCVGALKIGWPTLWIEWREPVRVAVRRGLGASEENGNETPERFGVLIRTDESGRRGRMTFAWCHPLELQPYGVVIPQICPYEIEFDFDRCSAPSGRKREPTLDDCLESDVGKRWKHSPEDMEALVILERSVERVEGVCFRDLALAWLQTIGPRDDAPEALEAYLASQIGDTDGEFLGTLAILLLLASRNGTENRSEGFERLNRKRRAKGKTELLSHDVVYLRLGKGEKSRGEAVGQGTIGGNGRRAHMVRGHVVNRGGLIYWRRAHMRGVGAATGKTVKVSL